jgi:hypothetical protein
VTVRWLLALLLIILGIDIFATANGCLIDLDSRMPILKD